MLRPNECTFTLATKRSQALELLERGFRLATKEERDSLVVEE